MYSKAGGMPAPGLTGKHVAGCELAGPGFAGKAPAYPQNSFHLKPSLEKPTPSPPVNSLAAPPAYPSGYYFQPLWNNILATPNSDSSGSQDLAMPFHGGQPIGVPLNCAAAPGAHY
ncbi:Protein FAM222B [Plecturocebus cupreus]